MRKTTCLAALLALTGSLPAQAADLFTVETSQIRDEKPVFATVESLNIIPARVRTGGTLVNLLVREGDMVTAGQVLATCADRRLAQQLQALDAQIDAMGAQSAQSQGELDRNRPLFEAGVISRTSFDNLQTAAKVAAAGLKARQAERAALTEQIAQGNVLAPAAGRVLTLPTAVGTVMMPGEVAATLARQDMIVRLELPERHAGLLTPGQAIRIEGAGLPATANVSLIYPHIQNGLVQADLKVTGGGSYFVGQRLRAWVPLESRPAVVIPAAALIQRFGLDYVRLHQPDGLIRETPVQRGQSQAMANGAQGVEILTGLQSGDLVVQP